MKKQVKSQKNGVLKSQQKNGSEHKTVRQLSVGNDIKVNTLLASTENVTEAKAMLIQNGKSKYLKDVHKSSKEEEVHTPLAMNPIDPKTLLLFDTIKQGSAQKVKSIFRQKNLNLNTRNLNDPRCPTALIAACEANSTEIVQLLMTSKKARQIDVNQEDKAGRRPIWIAAWKGNADIADILLNTKGAECDVNFIDKETGTSPLYRAILSNSADVLQLLIRAKADVNMRRMGKDLNCETPLIKAVQMNNQDIVDHLVNALCKIQAKTKEGFNALHFAVAYKRFEIAEYLLKNDIKIHAKSNNGITPMAVAIEHRNPAMVKLLVEYGYKMNKRYKWKETPLSQAINLHCEVEAMTLIHLGCEMEKKRGQSYFYMAVDENLMKLVKFMAAVYPQSLQEPWVKEREWPVSIYRRPDIINWLEHQSQKVRSLRQLCRGKIFRLMGKYPESKLKTLKLPENLLEYCSYRSHVRDEFFLRAPLDIKGDCPVDCPAICSKKYCPPIEFSSSSESDSDIDDDDVGNENSHANGKCKHNHEDSAAKKCCDYCS